MSRRSDSQPARGEEATPASGAVAHRSAEGRELADILRGVRAGAGFPREREAIARLMDTIPAGIVLLDRDGRFTFANAYVRQRLGDSAGDVTTLTLDSSQWSLCDGEGSPVARENQVFSRVMRTGKPVSRVRYQAQLGNRRFFLSVSGAPLLDAAGQPDGAVVVVEDVTERVQAEQRERKHAADLAFLTRTAMGFMELSPDGDIYRFIGEQVREIVGDAIIVVASHEDPEAGFRVRFATGMGPKLNAVIKLLGKRPEQLTIRANPDTIRAIARGRLTKLDHGIHQITNGLIPKTVADALQRLVGFGDIQVIGFTRGDEFLGTVSILTRPGVVLSNVSLLEAFVSQAAVAIERRQSEEKLRDVEEQLRQSHKLEAIGTLAGGLAHDFNNLLAAILGCASLMKLKLGPESQLYQHAELIETSAQGASELVKQLLGFARKRKLSKEPVEMHRVIDDVTSILTHTIDPRISITRSTDAQPTVVIGDSGQLKQVMLNLAVNARDAMPDGGQLRFATRTEELDAEFCRTRAHLRPGRYLVVSVADTGTGIPEAVRERVYEPFFTTKEPGSGTGMGLATSYAIAKGHGGELEFTSEIGGGTTFRVYLPLAEHVATPDEAAPPAEPIRGTGRVLVVDDEEAVRFGLEGMLRSLGYEAHCVHNGQEALDYYRDHGHKTDLVVLDVAMPVMNGLDCFRALKDLDPDVRVLASSGHADAAAPDRLLKAGAKGFLPKPYTREGLAEAVAEALGQ